jgi:hypothetical protein
MNKIILIDTIGFSVSPQLITEAEKSGGDLFVEGVIQRANAKNQNGRVYPKDVLETAVDAYIKSAIAENRSWGELDHPDSQIISLGNTCHKIVKLWWNGDDLCGRIKILKTPTGNIVRELLKEGNVGISSRGMGEVHPLGENTVSVSNYDLLCWDFVSTPSVHGSYMRPVNSNAINESVNYNIMAPSKYSNVNNLITEIMCARTGFCPCDLD